VGPIWPELNGCFSVQFQVDDLIAQGNTAAVRYVDRRKSVRALVNWFDRPSKLRMTESEEYECESEQYANTNTSIMEIRLKKVRRKRV
jgi:hypothetical protein